MSPSPWRRTKTSRTARESPSSMVNRSRSQSRQAPSASCCWPIREPYCSFPAEVVAALLLGPLQLLLHHHLRGDAGVVGAGEPHGVVAGELLPADQHVLQRGGQRVAEVERAGDVGG